MNIKQIETFVRIVELGSFQAAATHLHASPSTVSARIKELERFIGEDLFDRSFHRAQLTPKGRDFFESATQLVEFTRTLSNRIRANTAVRGHIRLGVVGVVANTWLPALVEGIRSQHPNVSIMLDVALTRALVDRLAEGKVDMAIIAGRIDDPDLSCEALGYDDFVWMAAPFDRSDDGGPLTPSALAELPTLALSEESHHYPIIRQWFRDAGVDMRPAVACNNLSVLAALATRGLGICLLPRHGYRAKIESGELITIASSPAIPAVPFSLVYRRNRRPMLVDQILALCLAVSDLSPAPSLPPTSA
ncbi:LysR family transcriptional regulator [Cupriavidus sp. 2SB]|uniref:LysR family transcriptional regulator n=1 Tax=Cupriavidus sp. 2SB TaxID=2502199 RepID=UPI0010F91DC9|nr:LysR family transcriptional regulator [Cupriavidus sp. 2SB]